MGHRRGQRPGLPGHSRPHERHEEGRRASSRRSSSRSKAWKAGVDGVFNVKNGGVGYGKVSEKAPNRVALVNLLGKWSKDIASGKVKPPRTVKG